MFRDQGLHIGVMQGVGERFCGGRFDNGATAFSVDGWEVCATNHILVCFRQRAKSSIASCPLESTALPYYMEFMISQLSHVNRAY